MTAAGFLNCFVSFLTSLALAAVIPASALAARPGWSTDLRPGDKVCLYDIEKTDPMVGHDSHSLKYWYRSPLGDQRSTRQLRPSIRKLLFRLLWPGIKVSKADRNGSWYSATLLVIKNGYKSKRSKPRLVDRAGNTLIIEKGLSFLPPWQVVRFDKVRLKKKPALGSCRRKYKVY